MATRQVLQSCKQNSTATSEQQSTHQLAVAAGGQRPLAHQGAAEETRDAPRHMHGVWRWGQLGRWRWTWWRWWWWSRNLPLPLIPRNSWRGRGGTSGRVSFTRRADSNLRLGCRCGGWCWCGSSVRACWLLRLLRLCVLHVLSPRLNAQLRGKNQENFRMAAHSGWTPSSSSPSTGPSQAASQSQSSGHCKPAGEDNIAGSLGASAAPGTKAAAGG
jgi:hypothetical protein